MSSLSAPHAAPPLLPAHPLRRAAGAIDSLLGCVVEHAAAAIVLVEIAVLFAGVGGWIGHRLTPRNRSGGFVRNAAAAASLGLSQRELEVLDRLASGAPNKVIARQLAISPNTVKTHLACLFEKLGASTRTEAIARARALDLVP